MVSTSTSSARPDLRMSEREVARMITRAEKDEAFAVARADTTGDGAHVIGVTGAPGSGKSTLVDALAREIRAQGRTVAILAIDPSSHVTGGAVLGDRVRMSSHSQDPGTFIRSMGTRGSTTGLARATRSAAAVLEKAGYDVVIVETVGVGQVELDVLTVADIVAVVLVPGLGDTMQMNKAGIMEIGDLFVVNMADREETPGFVRELKQALALGYRHDEMPPVRQTVALDGQGVDDLWVALEELADADRSSNAWADRRGEQSAQEFEQEIIRRVVRQLRTIMADSPSFIEQRAKVAAGEAAAGVAAEEWASRTTVSAGESSPC